MVTTPSALLDRLTRGRGDKALRYSAVSIIGIVITQSCLVLLHGILNIEATLANLAAVSVSAIPVFMLNKRWVWAKHGPAHLRREVLPFWGLTLVGLVLSTILVEIAHDYSDRTIWVMVANISGFGVLWVAKFLFLDTVAFRSDDEDR